MKRETLGDRVAQLRREKASKERRDIPQKEVAREMGVSRPVISETESGKTYPNAVTLKKLARYFGVSEMYLEYGVEASPALQGTAADKERPASELLAAKKSTKKADGKKRA